MSFWIRTEDGKLVNPNPKEWSQLWERLQAADAGDDDEDALAPLFVAHTPLPEPVTPSEAIRFTHQTVGALRALQARVRAAAMARPFPLGEVIVCLLVPADSQEEVLGDLTELFNVVWQPRFGRRCASALYVWHAVWLGQRLWRRALLCAGAEWLVRKIGL